MIVDPATAPRDEAENGGTLIYLSNAGGLTQFGAYLDRLMPGSVSSVRHWHEAEDEFLYLLDGIATVIDDDGEHVLRPGDACCWRHGEPNAHHVVNRSADPLTYLIVGSRVACDVCHYPDSGAKVVNSATHWQKLDADGRVIREGALPSELLGLRVVWGKPYDGILTRRVIRKGETVVDHGQPEQNAIMGNFEAHLYSDTGGLSQFGAFSETLMPGSRSSERHWHEAEDEFLYMLDGAATVIEDDGPHVLTLGFAACWPAGIPNAHHVMNHTDTPCTYLIVGTRLPSDRVHYADVDKLYSRKDGVATRTRRDGSPL